MALRVLLLIFKGWIFSNISLYAQQDTTHLTPIEVIDSKLKKKTYGNRFSSSAMCSNLGNGKKGSEVAIIIPLKNKKIYPQNFKVHVTDYPRRRTTKYDLKFYTVIDKRIDSLLFKQKIEGHLKIKNGFFEIDLSKYNLTISNDFAVSLALRDTLDKNNIFFSIGFLGHKAYVKEQNSDWKKIEAPFSVGYQLEAYVEKLKPQ